MTTTKLTTVNIVSTTSQSTGSVVFNATTTQHQGNISLKFLSGCLNFANVSDYTDFVTTVIIPLTNTLNSPSGSGSGYVAMTPGVPGSDAVS